MAMLQLAAEVGGRGFAVVTVNHGLRSEAADEATMVAETCARFGLEHSVLHWQGWDGSGNLQDRARDARYRLISDWARGQSINGILLAHTVEDQAETFLMRLARAAGVDGLSAMSDRVVGGVRFHRPLLAAKRADLRAYLTAKRLTWAEDPSNDDPSYDRVRVRALTGALTQIGLTPANLTQVADNLAQARDALNWAVQGFAQEHVQMVGPDLTIEAQAFGRLPTELKRRLLVHALRWMSGADYAPRRASVAGLIREIDKGQGTTLHGTRLTQRKGRLWLFREYAAIRDVRADPSKPWDARWRLSGPSQPGDSVAPLGPEGLVQLTEWRQTGRPAAALHADPGVWRDGCLIAAPVSGWPNQWLAQPAKDRTDFVSTLSTH